MRQMKYLLALALMLTLTMTVGAQTMTKEEQKDLEKEVRRYEKDGWEVTPGALPLKQQIARSWKAQEEKDSKGNDKWQIGSANSVGTVYDAARMQAIVIAKNQLKDLIASSLTNRYYSGLKTKKSRQEKAESMAKTAMKTKATVVDRYLSSPRILFDAFRRLKNGNVEVAVRLAVQTQQIEDIADNLYAAKK